MKITPRALPADIWVVALFAGAAIMYLAHSLRVTIVVWLVLLVGGIIAAVLMANAKPQFQHHAAGRPVARPVARPAIGPGAVPGVTVQVAVQQHNVQQVQQAAPDHSAIAMAAELAVLRAQLAALQGGGQHLHLHGVTPEQIARQPHARPSVSLPATARDHR